MQSITWLRKCIYWMVDPYNFAATAKCIPVKPVTCLNGPMAMSDFGGARSFACGDLSDGVCVHSDEYATNGIQHLTSVSAGYF